MGEIVAFPDRPKRPSRSSGEPARITILPVVRVERTYGDLIAEAEVARMTLSTRRLAAVGHEFVLWTGKPRGLTLADRRIIGARYGLDENGEPLPGTPKL